MYRHMHIYSFTHTHTHTHTQEDHCRIISMQKGGNVFEVFSRFCKISDTIKQAAKQNKADLMYDT